MAYFPPLDRCLTGKEALVSWNAVLNELLFETGETVQLEVKSFLSSDTAIDTLLNSQQPFSGRDGQSKRDFETRTAPIHTSSASSGAYNLEHFKADALWLSQELDIHEVAALRLVIIEWQARPADLLLGRVFDESNKTNKSKEISEAARHRRLLQTHLREASAIKQICAIFLALDKHTSTELWLLQLAEKLRQRRSSQGITEEQLVAATITNFKKQVSYLEDNQNWPACIRSDFALHPDFSTAVLRDMASNIRQGLASHLKSGVMANTETVLSWFETMQKTNFLQELSPATPDQAILSEVVQYLVSAYSAALLSLPAAIAEIDKIAGQSTVTYPRLDTKPYIADDLCVRDLNLIIFQAAEAASPVAAPAVYAWSIITMYIRDLTRMEQEAMQQLEDSDSHHGSNTRRHSAIEQKYDNLQDRQLGPARDDPPQYLARQAADVMQVYGIIAELSRLLSVAFCSKIENATALGARTVLFEIVKESLPTVTYDEHIIEAVLALISPDPQSPACTTLATNLWHDRTKCYPLLFQQALARFPYELSPLLRLVGTLAGNLPSTSDDWTSVIESFESLSSITWTLPEGFRGYALDHEEDGANAIRLTEALPIFVEKATLRSYDDESHALVGQQTSLRIPADTYGTILRDSRPFIVSLRHEFSGLNYAGLLLSTMVNGARYQLAPPLPSADNFMAADILNLVVTFLRGAADRSSVAHILEELGASIPNGLDAVSVVIELLEHELIARAEQQNEAGSNELVIHCMKFLQLISQYYPERLWAFLSQSMLLDSRNGSSALLATSGTPEDQARQFELICESMHLYETAVDDAVRGLVRRKQTSTTRSGSRFDSPMESLGEISERVITQVLTAYTNLALEILQGLAQRQIASPKHKSETVKSITGAFQKLFVYVYGIGESSAASPTKSLTAAAQIAAAAFLPDDVNVLTISPLLTPLQSLVMLDARTLPIDQKTALVEEARSILDLLRTLLRMARTSHKCAARLTTALASSMSVLASLFALHASFKGTIADILAEMIQTSAIDTVEPVSIFNQLSPQQGSHFLDLLTRFDSSLTDTISECKVWSLFAAACQYNQQWFAMYLLTGALPKDNIKELAKDKKTTLAYALDLLSDVKNINPDKAAAILQFVAEAQKTWSWATTSVRRHADFITNTLDWLNDLKPAPRTANTADALLSAREYRSAASFCDVLAVNIHASLELGDRSLGKSIAAKAAFLAQHAVSVNGFNQNLHRNLTKNLSDRFSGFTLDDMKRTAVNPGNFGTDYRYDVDTAHHFLQHDASWQGNIRHRSKGFLDEVHRANVNWSLYDAQISLLQDWKTLAITLTDSNDSDPALNQILLTTVESSLTACIDTNLDDPEGAAVLQTRLELVFTLMSRLSKTACDKKTADTILQQTWSLLIRSPVNFDVASADTDLTYYRTLLRVLFLSLTLSNSSTPPQSSRKDDVMVLDGFDKESLLVDVMTRTIAAGFRALCGNLHDSMDCALPEDFAVLIALSRAVLSASPSKRCARLMADAIAFSGAIRSAASLFSWSDRLAESTCDDPVYAEMAVMFLSTLSRIPQIAEQMAVDNILTQLSSANVSNYFRKPGGKTPFDEPSRMFVIWSDGFLPLCLNLLEAVGPPVAADVSSFFTSFPEQLNRAQQALQNATATQRNPRAGAVTLGLIAETRDLITIARILQAASRLGAAEGIAPDDIEALHYDIKIVQEDLEGLTKSSRSLRDRIVPTTAREFALYNDKTGGSSDDALQAAIVREVEQALALLKD